MKKTLVMMLSVFLIFTTATFTQVLEKDNIQALSKDARKGELLTFSYNDESQEYTLVFGREKKKTNIYEIYLFDYDFNLLQNETLEQKQAEEKYSHVLDFNPPSDVWTDPKVVRVEPNLGGQIVLKQGILSREWTKSVEDKGNYRYTTWYWKYNFNEIQRVTPKFEGLMDIPEGAPKFVINMAKKAGEKVVLLAYATDEPTVNITTGKQNFVYGSIWARSKDYAAASGDILIIGRSDQMDYDTKQQKQVFLSMKYSAEDLSRKHYETFELGYLVNLVYHKVLADGSMAMIFAPYSGPGIKNKDPNPMHWHYVRIAKDATVKDKLDFESGGWWAVSNAVLTNDDDVLIYGTALAKNKSKYFTPGVGMSKVDNIQVMKVSNGEIAYINNADLKMIASEMQSPGNQKKAKPFAGKDMFLTQNYALSSSGDLIFSGEAADHQTLYAFHFDPEGTLKAHYVVGMEMQSKEHGVEHTLFENSDKETITFFIAELVKIDNGRALKVPRIASIDISKGTISDIETYGFGKKGKFYLDDIFPFTFIDEGRRVVFFSRDEKDANVWVGRVKLGR